jgi:hypothetical protein
MPLLSNERLFSDCSPLSLALSTVLLPKLGQREMAGDLGIQTPVKVCIQDPKIFPFA